MVVSLETTERKHAEKAVAESEVKYRSLFNNINISVALHEIIIDKNGKAIDFIWLDANSKYEEMTHLKKK